MYRCGICECVAPPRQPMRRHPVYRPDGSILREVAACPACARHLDAGHSISQVRAERHKPVAVPAQAPLEARLRLPVQVGTPSQEEDWRDAGIRGVLMATRVGGTGQVAVKEGLFLRFKRSGTNEWQFGVGVKAVKVDVLDAVRHVKKNMG